MSAEETVTKATDGKTLNGLGKDLYQEVVLFRSGQSPRDELCGLGTWRPKWLQRFANRKFYALAYVIIGIVQGMILAYFSGVLTTLEKVFGIQSSTMGIVLTGNDISQILGGLFVNHLGQRGSRPFWLGIGMVTTGISCFMYAASHLLWDSSHYDSYVELRQSNSPNASDNMNLCFQTSSFNRNHTTDQLGTTNAAQSNIAVLILLFSGQLISGIGSTALFSLGFTYMDDSVKKRSSPLYTGITMSLRHFGPVLGFLLASFCLGFNVRVTEKSPYAVNDPLYIGAWWLGFLLLGFLQVLITVPMVMFPKILPSEKSLSRMNLQTAKILEINDNVEESVWRDFKESLVRVLKNRVVIAYLLSIGPIILGVVGSAIFMPKYMEAQFGQTPGKANIYSGISGMAMIMIGIFLGGVLLWKFQPRAFYVAGIGSIVDCIHIVTTILMMFMNCDNVKFAGVEFHEHGRYDITSECSQNCNCGTEFNPVCVGTTNFLSPCMAGCTQANVNNNKMFLNCMCATPLLANLTTSLVNIADLATGWPTAQSGYCPGGRTDCAYLWPYIILNGMSKLFGSTMRIGFILILIRSAEKRDKSLVMALMMVVASLTGFIPGPIIFGAALDNTCLLWDEKKKGGRKGNCWVYDSQAFSYWYHGLKIACYVITTIMSLFICYYGRHVNLYDEDEVINAKIKLKKQQQEQQPKYKQDNSRF